MDELINNWKEFLARLKGNGLKISSSKTVICPVQTELLGWIWKEGTLRASPHKICPLASVEPPSTVKMLRSFLGAYKQLARCIPKCSLILSDLESMAAGKQSSEKLLWSEDSLHLFHKSQKALDTARCITIPRPDDHILITVDAAKNSIRASEMGGIGGELHVVREGRQLCGGFFSCKLRDHQRSWLPCEIEALAISCCIKHWADVIRRSLHIVEIQTDSIPCCLAFGKLQRGEFSSSMRVSTFLTTISQHNIKLMHIKPGCRLLFQIASEL